MTKVKIDSGICGMTTTVTAVYDDEEDTVALTADTMCPAIRAMMDALGDTFDMFDVTMIKPGTGPFYGYASEKLPVHPGCPVCAGIYKCIEAECNLALKKNVSIEFVD